jgi:hypothetical protein
MQGPRWVRSWSTLAQSPRSSPDLVRPLPCSGPDAELLRARFC